MAEELPFSLWVDRTTTKTETCKTPYSLVFRVEAVILTKLVISTGRYQLHTKDNNDRILAQDLDTMM